MRVRARRWLFLVHRWLGIVACTFFAMWFVSGVVMMYVGYPRLTEAERLRHLPPLEATGGLLGPRQALDAARIEGPLKELRLAVASGGRAVYLATPADAARVPAPGQRVARGAGVVVVDARTGTVVQQVDEAHALASAAAYAGPGIAARYLGTVGEDAYTHSRALDAHRPLHRVRLDDAAGTLLYVSSRTGEVVRDAPRVERLWNYAGAWIHWLYPFRGNVFDRYWSDIVIWLSVLATIVALTGSVIGILRWRFRRPHLSGSRSPYRDGMMRWHHLTGLLFAAVTLTWIFSGLMSMNPWGVFRNAAPPLQTEAFQGGPLEISAQEAHPAALLAAAGGTVRELRWIRSLGRTWVTAHGDSGRPILLDGRDARRDRLDLARLEAAASRLLAAPVVRIENLARHDLYYYTRAPHTMTGGGDRPLPAMRVVFGDAYGTWVHIDPHTGAVLGRVDRDRRLSRWLFAMLHSWDWLPLLERRPLWDLVLIVLSIGGALLSVTGVVIGWRRLRRTARA